MILKWVLVPVPKTNPYVFRIRSRFRSFCNIIFDGFCHLSLKPYPELNIKWQIHIKVIYFFPLQYCGSSQTNVGFDLSPKTSLLEATLASLGIYLIDIQMILKWVLVPVPQTHSIRSRKQLASYAGLDVIAKQSGNEDPKHVISKKGNAHIRRVLFFPGMSAAHHNPQQKELYSRLCAKNPKVKMVGVVATMRKLLLLIYTLWKSGETYDPTRITTSTPMSKAENRIVDKEGRLLEPLPDVMPAYLASTDSPTGYPPF